VVNPDRVLQPRRVQRNKMPDNLALCAELRTFTSYRSAAGRGGAMRSFEVAGSCRAASVRGAECVDLVVLCEVDENVEFICGGQLFDDAAVRTTMSRRMLGPL
jgi:hypothetical protein